MKTWYIAICDKCGKARNILVNGNYNLQNYIEDKAVSDWLAEHYGCNALRMIWRDDQLDKFFDSGWERVKPEYKHGKIVPNINEYEKTIYPNGYYKNCRVWCSPKEESKRTAGILVDYDEKEDVYFVKNANDPNKMYLLKDTKDYGGMSFRSKEQS